MTKVAKCVIFLGSLYIWFSHYRVGFTNPEEMAIESDMSGLSSCWIIVRIRSGGHGGAWRLFRDDSDSDRVLS